MAESVSLDGEYEGPERDLAVAVAMLHGAAVFLEQAGAPPRFVQATTVLAREALENLVRRMEAAGVPQEKWPAAVLDIRVREAATVEATAPPPDGMVN